MTLPGIYVDIPNMGKIHLTHLLLDLNGTIANEGQLIPEIIPQIKKLKSLLEISIISADTYGKGTQIANYLGVNLIKLTKTEDEQIQKGRIVERLGKEHCVAMGNGNNDLEMLSNAQIGIGIIGAEGAAAKILLHADIVVTKPEHGLNLLLNPTGLIATLRI